MSQRDRDAGSRQAGGYRSDDDVWDSPRQPSQWQPDASRQAGSSRDPDYEERASYADRNAQTRRAAPSTDERYGSETRAGAGDQRSARWPEDSHGGYPEDSHGGYGAGPAHRGHSDRFQADRYEGQRDYRFSGARSAEYPRRDFDASGGNDFGSFTSQDYGGRDFTNRGGGLSGGQRSSESYRPGYGVDSRSRSRDQGGNDYDDWRGYGEHRGFLQRAGDEVASWFGDEDAARRREQDHRGRGPSDYTRSDERIREDVNDSLTHDWRVDASSVRVTVKDGEVTLAGTVENRQHKRRAEDLADAVSGVRHVQNDLRVQGQTAGTSAPGYSHTTGGTAAAGTTSSETSPTSGARPAGIGTGSGAGDPTG